MEVLSAPNRPRRKRAPGDMYRMAVPTATPAKATTHQARVRVRPAPGRAHRLSNRTAASTTNTTIDVSSDRVPMNTPARYATPSAKSRPRRVRARSSGITAAQASTGATVCETEEAGQ